MKRRLALAVKFLTSAALLAIVYLKVDWSQFTLPEGNGRAFYLVYGVCGGIIFNLLKFLKWQNLIQNVGRHRSYWDAAKSYMIGNSLGLATPLRVGEFGRALYFEKVDRPQIVSLTLIDRMVELLVVMLLAVAGIFYLVSRPAAILVAIAGVAGILTIYSMGSLDAFARKLLPALNHKGTISRYADILKSVDCKKISTNLVLSLAAFLSVILQLFFLISSFSNVNLGSAFLAGPLITISSIMPVSFMGLGVREGISVILFANFGVAGSVAVAAAFLLFLINNVFIGLIGIVFLWRLP